MNLSDFYRYINNPKELNASTVAELQEVLDSYPYFQTAHLLYLKSLYNQNNFKFNEQLKFSSVHLSNRKKLLFYLKDKYPQSQSVESTIHDTEHIVKQEINKGLKDQLSSKEKEPTGKSAVQVTEIEKPLTPQLEEKPKEVKKETEKEQKFANESKTRLADIKLNPTSSKIDNKQKLDSKIKKEVGKDSEVKLNTHPSLPKNRDELLGKRTLSPQEIIQKRIAELSKPKIEEKESKNTLKNENHKHFSTKVESSTKIGIKKKNEEGPKKEDLDVDVLSEISDRIQIEAPSEYFLEEEPKDFKEIVKSLSSSPEKLSFSDWLDQLSKPNKRLSATPKEAKENLVKPIRKPLKKKQLVDSFLSNTKSKRIKPQKTKESTVKKEPVSSNPEESLSFMTETLAQIYIKQAYYEKAIQAYRKLSLKYPKKNTYFASQIEKIEKLQLNS